ncbi:DUF2164 domain-containing protein [Salirhabdus sp. Marseille-P4669]|uniref:DUF2164 domain-containing protein n=1 Tax=Salirhabdus sp. Marseille-P4669 TaxID=2042310 RepID=UPI001F3951F6|nr:DUF2164 domain-containing protein [Salirhabdus sp. Marseille-P4669]
MNLNNRYKEEMKSKINTFFQEERGEEIGELATQIVLDFVLKELSPYIYNQGIKDAKTIVEQKVMNLEEDLSSLERRI